MQWGDFVAELWLYVPLVGFWLVAIILGLVGIAASIRSRNRPGGLDYEFASSEPEELPPRLRPQDEGTLPGASKHSVRLARAPEAGEFPQD